MLGCFYVYLFWINQDYLDSILEELGLDGSLSFWGLIQVLKLTLIDGSYLALVIKWLYVIHISFRMFANYDDLLTLYFCDPLGGHTTKLIYPLIFQGDFHPFL